MYTRNRVCPMEEIFDGGATHSTVFIGVFVCLCASSGVPARYIVAANAKWHMEILPFAKSMGIFSFGAQPHTSHTQDLVLGMFCILERIRMVYKAGIRLVDCV